MFGRVFELGLLQSYLQRKEAKYSMTITKIAAVVTLAVASLTLGACAHKQCCQQPAPCKSK